MIDWNKIVYAGDLLAATFRLNSPVFVPYRPARDYTPGMPTGIKSDGADSFLPEVYSNLRVASVPETERLSQFGTPVLDSFTFEMGEYNTYKQGALVKTTMPDFLLPYATIVSFTRSMNMTQTKTLGNNGTVKEIYGLDDWEINIQGICLTDDTRPAQRTADEQADELIRWRQVADTINVRGDIFANKNIYALCIKSLSINPEQGRPGVIPFTIEAVSDEPVELILL